jgi:hypothetical protein
VYIRLHICRVCRITRGKGTLTRAGDSAYSDEVRSLDSWKEIRDIHPFRDQSVHWRGRTQDSAEVLCRSIASVDGRAYVDVSTNGGREGDMLSDLCILNVGTGLGFEFRSV